jgi:hypothetical protein
MFRLTDAAAERLARKLTDAEASQDISARCVRRGEGRGWGLRLDNARPQDVTFAHQGRTVLLLDAGVARQLTHKTLDVCDTDKGPKLQFV